MRECWRRFSIEAKPTFAVQLRDGWWRISYNTFRIGPYSAVAADANSQWQHWSGFESEAGLAVATLAGHATIPPFDVEWMHKQVEYLFSHLQSQFIYTCPIYGWLFVDWNI